MTRALAEFAAGTSYDALPGPLVERLEQCLLDFVGNTAFAGANAESSAAFRAAVNALAPRSGSATVVGERRGYPAQYAALLNGAFAHSLDFDDTNLWGALHPGAVVIPVALAVAERLDVTGRALVEGLAAGYEVSCRVGAALGPTAYDRGFHITAVAGIFGGVAAGARLLGLDGARTANAFGLALSQAAGSMQYLENGSWNKRLHPGFAAHDALVSLTLTESGTLGAAAPLEGRYGLLAGYSNAPRPALLTEELGRRWVAGETAVKPYPSCRLTHGAIDAVLDLRDKVEPGLREAATIRLRLSPKAVQIVGEAVDRKLRPRNVVDGQFSVYFQVAAAWLDGRVDWSSYERLGEGAMEQLTSRITVEVEEALPLAGADVTITAGGREARQRVEQPLGEPERPVPWELLETKFRGLATAVLGARRCRAIVAAARGLDALPSARRWVRMLRGREAGR